MLKSGEELHFSLSLMCFVLRVLAAFERKVSAPVAVMRQHSDVEILDGGDEGGIVLDIHDDGER